jgi:hypothetical protein
LVKLSEEVIMEKLDKYKHTEIMTVSISGLMSKPRLNISAEEGCERKLRKLLESQNEISNLRVDGCDDVDVLGEVNGRYETLYSLYLRVCNFSNQKKFEEFLGYLLKAKGLTRMTFYDVTIK